MQNPSRREFLEAVGGTLAVVACRSASDSGPPPGAPRAGEVKLPATRSMPKRVLGRSGEQVSLIGLGGYHIGSQRDEAESIRIIERAIDHGVTFLDNCWDYNEGQSELRMGKALRGKRQNVFLMTKIDGRTRESATAQLEQSLGRLRTDVIDLLQIHEIIRPGDPAQCFAPGGTVEALLRAKEQGKIRYIGFTGHKDPDYHLAMLEAGFKHGLVFDTVQMPLNVMDAHYKSFEKKVLPVLVKHGIGVLGMKPLGAGKILESGVVSAEECLHYAMSLPTSVVITGCDSVGVLDQALKAAYDHAPLSQTAIAALLARTAPLAQNGKFEEFKTTQKYDGTEQHPGWLKAAKL